MEGVLQMYIEGGGCREYEYVCCSYMKVYIET